MFNRTFESDILIFTFYVSLHPQNFMRDKIDRIGHYFSFFICPVKYEKPLNMFTLRLQTFQFGRGIPLTCKRCNNSFDIQ